MSKGNQLVAVITGSSRGIGKGIAKVLGEREATVYVTGRTEVSGTQKSPNGDPVPGSIHEVAEEINKLGGKGIAVAVDLTDDKQIRDLFERVQREQGHLNILVNNAAYLNEKMHVRPFWDAPVDRANIIAVGLRCHHVATYYAAPLLIKGKRGLIVNISFYGDAKVHDPAYYASKAGLDKTGAGLRRRIQTFQHRRCISLAGICSDGTTGASSRARSLSQRAQGQIRPGEYGVQWSSHQCPLR